MNRFIKILQPKVLISFLAATIICTVFCVEQSSAQVPPRFYWKNLNGVNAVPVIFNSLESNANPADPSHHIYPGAKIEADLMIAGYAKVFELMDRAAFVAALVPMGRVSGDVTVGGRSFSESARGFGDPMIEFGINVIGPDPIRNIPDMLRYEPGFSVDIIGDLIFPLGEYDNAQPLNIGQNRWAGRVGAPVIWQLGQWVPGKRTTLELIPSVWFFADNNDFVGLTLSTDPLFELEGHLTRDLTKDLWASFDLTYFIGGDSSLNGVKSESLDKAGVGFTLGYAINEHIQLTVGYMSTFNDNDDTELNMDRFLVSLTFGWHNLIEGMNRLGSSE